MMELKPCPFCGATPTIKQDKRWPRDSEVSVQAYEVVCTNYHCVIYLADNVYSLTEKDAVDAWNRRVTDGTERKAD